MYSIIIEAITHSGRLRTTELIVTLHASISHDDMAQNQCDQYRK